MPKRQETAITKRTVKALSVEGRDAVFWDRDLPGFGIRVYPSGLKKYVVQSRGPGGSRRATLGRHGDTSPEQARRDAAEAIDRIKRGEEPLPPAPEPEPTMADIAKLYMRDYVPAHCKASSAEVYRRALDIHILPVLGEMPVGAVGSEHVSELHYAMRGEPHAANAALKIVGKMLSLAVEWDLREAGPNPCRAVRKYRTRPRERFLTDAEYCRLGRAVDVLEARGKVSRPAAAAIRLLVMTGCRRNEVLELRWDDVDRTAGELRLRDGKTGARMVPLTPAVSGVLEGIPRVPDNPWVIVGQKPGARLVNVGDPWLLVRAGAGLDGVRIHDLRHSWASRALALGESLSMIGKLLGHTRIETTARYAHLERDTEKVSAAMVADGTNPCRGVRKFPTRPRERFLTDTEFRRLGTVLDRAEADGGVSGHAVAAIRLLLLTGCRKSEILSLRWEDVDVAAGEIRLADSKTGPRAVPLSPPAVRVLAELPRLPGSSWVIPGQKLGTHLTNLDGPWWIVRERAGLEEVRIHDCRHSFASRALALGESLPVIAKLLGHSQIQTTARYAHLARDSVKASAARVAASIAGDFLHGGGSATANP